MLLLIGLALFLHPGCFCLAYIIRHTGVYENAKLAHILAHDLSDIIIRKSVCETVPHIINQHVIYGSKSVAIYLVYKSACYIS